MKQKKKKIRIAALITVLSVLVLFFAVFLLFQTRKIEVTGNQYCQDEELVKCVQKEKYSFNSIYICWKYIYGYVTKTAAIESVKFSIKNPWTVVMKVKEKEFLGYFDYQGEFLYFDESNKYELSSDRLTCSDGGVNLIFGVVTVQLGKGNYEMKIAQISPILEKLNEKFTGQDRLTCSDGGVNLIFGVVTVQLGKGNYEMKIAQISPILEKLNEKFTGQAGVLHLENYETSGTSVRFVPEKAAEAKAGEGQDAGQTDENESGESEAAQTDQTSAAGTGEGETTE